MVLRKVDDHEGTLTVDVDYRISWIDEGVIVPAAVADMDLIPIANTEIMDKLWKPKILHTGIKSVLNIDFIQVQTGNGILCIHKLNETLDLIPFLSYRNGLFSKDQKGWLWVYNLDGVMVPA